MEKDNCAKIKTCKTTVKHLKMRQMTDQNQIMLKVLVQAIMKAKFHFHKIPKVQISNLTKMIKKKKE